jgi:hypothetical protein
LNAAEVLEQILSEVSEVPAGDDVEFVGADPVLPSPLRIGEAGAATIAAAGLAAARVWLSRGGRRQTGRVEVDAAAAAMRSSRYLTVESSAPHEADGAGGQFVDFRPRAGRGGLGVYPARDGRWVYLHRTFPHHRARICSVLECADDDNDIAAAVKGWDALALEDAVVGAGACDVGSVQCCRVAWARPGSRHCGAATAGNRAHRRQPTYPTPTRG